MHLLKFSRILGVSSSHITFTKISSTIDSENDNQQWFVLFEHLKILVLFILQLPRAKFDFNFGLTTTKGHSLSIFITIVINIGAEFGSHG